MEKLPVLLFIVVAFVFVQIEGYQMTRCELVKQLRRHGFPEDKLRNWVCLVENESGRRTDKVGPVNKNGSRDHGLFQINDKYWCSNTSQPGKDCHVTCHDVTTDDITKASECAKKIFKRHGFRAWYGWRNHCQGALPDIPNCH